MGTYYQYKCPKCNYSVQTSGKHDIGMLIVTDSYICNSCQEIVDVTVGLRGETFLKEEIELKKRRENISDIDFYVCPECGSEDIVKWDTKRKPCPKCNGRMKKDKNGEIIMWD